MIKLIIVIGIIAGYYRLTNWLTGNTVNGAAGIVNLLDCDESFEAGMEEKR